VRDPVRREWLIRRVGDGQSSGAQVFSIHRPAAAGAGITAEELWKK
jgi:hypothetical protein